TVLIPQLLCALACKILHVILRAEVQAACGARLDASGLKAFADPVGAECAFVNAFGDGVELRNIEGAAGDAIAAADAVVLLKIDDAVGVLHDRAVRRAGLQPAAPAPRHPLLFPHHPLQQPTSSFSP